MAIREMYMRTGGSDLNAGSTNNDAPAFTYASGNLATVTNVATFTVTSGNPQTDGVQVGDVCSIYVDGDTATPFVGVVTGVTSTTITAATNANRIGTIPSDGTGNRSLRIGGAWAGLGLCASGRILGISATNAWSAMRINVQAGTYGNSGTARSIAFIGATTLPILWRGYKTSPGDMDSNPTAARVAGTDIPSFTWGDAGFTAGVGHHLFENLSFVSARTGGATVTAGAASLPVRFRRCQIENTNAGASSSAVSASGAGGATVFDSCWLKATTTASRVLQSTHALSVIRCRLIGGILGIEISGSVNLLADQTIITGCTSHGIQAGSALTVVSRCSFYATGGDAVRLTSFGTNPYGSVMSCRFSNSGGYDINNSSGTNTATIYLRGNVSHNPTSGHLNGFGDFPEFAALTDASSPFNAAGSGDFSPASGSNGNSVQTNFENDANASYNDVGAVQRNSAGTPDYPLEADVQSGVTYASGTKTGTFVSPAAGNVRSGIGYGAAGAEFTGTCAVPTAANVRSGTAVDAGTGTLAVPSAGDVRSGVAVDAGTGTCNVPAAANVKSGVAVDATTGTLTQPSADQVKLGTQYGSGGDEFTGTFIVSINLNLAGQFSG